MIESRFYRIKGIKWEARFFAKDELFPETTTKVARQGVWARPASSGWEKALFAGNSWRFVNMDLDVSFLPELK